MNALEALACAIMWREGEPGYRPPARSFRNNNPGNLRTPGWSSHDAGGYDVYADFVTGFNRLLFDLKCKFIAGANSHGLGPTSTLADLFLVYAPAEDANDPASYAAFAAEWLTLALGRAVTVTDALGSIWTAAQA